MDRNFLAGGPPISVSDYFQQAETNRTRELVWGVVREPPSPFYSHQAIVLAIASALRDHVHGTERGKVIVSPMDVVLDTSRGLIVQPDVMVVLNERLHILRERCWGAPDLVIEVLSPSTAAYDRRVKMPWYRRYGVRECWLANVQRQAVEVIDLTRPRSRPRSFTGRAFVQSRVLPELNVRTGALLS